MTTKKKAIITVVIVLGIAGAVGYGMYVRNRDVVSVQVGRVERQNLTQSVTANGEIKPKKYVNISSNTMGRIVEMPVKEGDHVREGDLLIRLDAVQTQADLQGAQANLDAAQVDLEGMSASERSAAAAINTARAEVTRSEAELKRTQDNFDRADRLNKDGLISKEQFDRAKTELEISAAQVASARARVAQSEALAAQVGKQREGVALRINQQRATLTRARDQFGKSTITSPLDGIITHLPVNEGEIAIVGVQNQAGTILMTIADMSIITAEVAVDETDIVNVRLGQPAEVKVDALGNQSLVGRVSEIGNSALTRSGGLANGPTNSQEAKDFKVVITLENPPPALRPGLSCTATIVTATRDRVLTIPIQALTVREVDDLAGNKKKVEQEGVFVMKNSLAFFRPVKTGIIGTTDIEVLEGLNENDEIVTGTYQVLRTLKDNAKIKVAEQP